MSRIHDRVRVRVEAEPVVSVCLMKGDLTILKETVGRLEIDVPPGLYMMRFASPTAIRDQIFEVSGNEEELSLTVPAGLVVTSPAPLARVTLNKDHESLAVRLSVATPVSLSGDASLFVFVRQLPETPASSDHPTAHLSLRSSSGSPLYEFDGLPDYNGCTGVNLAVAPGTYLLRVDREGDAPPIEQAVVVCAGWQTQVFLPLESLTCDEPSPRPQLEHAAVFMAQQGLGFQPAKPASEWTEMARAWLARGRPAVPIVAVKQALDDAREVRRQTVDPQIVRRMLREKLSNPMLGIYAAHLTIIHSSPDEAQLREISDTLTDLIGEHPDVLAIDLWLSAKRSWAPYGSPPMLRTSWDILVNRSREHGQLVPSGSYTARLGGRLWGSGAWLTWCAPPETDTVPAPATVDLMALAEQIRQSLGARSAFQALHAFGHERFTPAEVAVFRYIANVLYGENYVKEVAATTGDASFTQAAETFVHKELTADAMLQKLEIPAASLNEAAATLGQKLRAQASPAAR